MSELIPAMQFELDAPDLGSFSRHLEQLGLPHRLSEQKGFMVLWVYDETHVMIARELYNRFLHNDLPPLVSEKQTPLHVMDTLKTYPVTLALIVLSIAGFLIIQFEWMQALSLLSYQGFSWDTREIVINDNALVINNILQGQIWRILTPVFLHFDIMHITFNMTLLWFFGSQVERGEGSLVLLSHVLLIGILSNTLQFYSAAENLFGGMSGVDYGLLAYCFLTNILNKRHIFQVPSGFFWFSLLMLVLGFLNIFSIFGYAVANIVHLMGLLMGFLLAVVFKNKKRFC